MKLYFKQEMQYFYNEKTEYPAYLIAMGEHCGFPFYVKNLNGCHPTAYVQVPSTHPMYGKRLKEWTRPEDDGMRTFHTLDEARAYKERLVEKQTEEDGFNIKRVVE